MHRINLKGGMALLTIVLAGGLAACQKESSEADWYLLSTVSQSPEAVSVSPFGKDHAKCDKFAAKFPKALESRCISGREFEELAQARHWRCVQGVCASAANS